LGLLQVSVDADLLVNRIGDRLLFARRQACDLRVADISRLAVVNGKDTLWKADA
jgi:hypothetical protein